MTRVPAARPSRATAGTCAISLPSRLEMIGHIIMQGQLGILLYDMYTINKTAQGHYD